MYFFFARVVVVLLVTLPACRFELGTRICIAGDTNIDNDDNETRQTVNNE